MTRLLEAVRPDARLVLVGDPDQLASVEAGAVLADLVGRVRADAADSPVATLETRTAPRRTRWRARTAGQGDARERRRQDDRRARVHQRRRARRPGGPRRHGGVPPGWWPCRAIADAAQDSETELATTRSRAPAAVRPPRGALRRRRLEPAGRAAIGRERRGRPLDEWYAGRPVLITANDRGPGLSNGDLGVTVRRTTAGCA